MRPADRLSGHLELAGIGLLWGSSSLLIRLIDQSPLYITCGRFAFGALAVVVWGLVTGRRDWSPGPRPWLLLGVAAWMALSTAAFAAGVKFTSIANAVLIAFSAPMLVPFLGALVLKEPVRKSAVVAVLLALTGIVLMLAPDVGVLDRRSLIGIGFAALSASGVAGATIGVRLVRRHTPTFNTGLYRMVVAAVVLAPLVVVTGALGIDARSLLLLATLGVVHTGLGMTLFAHAIARVEAQDAVVYGYFEPLGSVVLAAVFLGEALRPGVVVGGALILAGGLLASRSPRGHTLDV
jgi:drug/metabolite transporter (DMT)-like permease